MDEDKFNNRMGLILVAYLVIVGVASVAYLIAAFPSIDDSNKMTFPFFTGGADRPLLMLAFAAGVTGKIRDAEISLYGPQAASKTNTGFVPLINLHAEWRPGGGAFGVLLDADALVAPQGRAEDVTLALTWDADEKITLRAGYRMLEGGADNDEVYNFAWIHYAVVGASLRL